MVLNIGETIPNEHCYEYSSKHNPILVVRLGVELDHLDAAFVTEYLRLLVRLHLYLQLLVVALLPHDGPHLVAYVLQGGGEDDAVHLQLVSQLLARIRHLSIVEHLTLVVRAVYERSRRYDLSKGLVVQTVRRRVVHQVGDEVDQHVVNGLHFLVLEREHLRLIPPHQLERSVRLSRLIFQQLGDVVVDLLILLFLLPVLLFLLFVVTDVLHQFLNAQFVDDARQCLRGIHGAHGSVAGVQLEQCTEVVVAHVEERHLHAPYQARVLR